MASNALSSLRVRTARLSVLSRLAEEIGETCNIAIPDREAMVYLDRVETKWPLRIQLPVGTQVPFYCTASGKMYLSTLTAAHLERYVAATPLVARTPATLTDPDRLLAEIAAVRAQGHALDREEFMPDMIALAVPIRDAHDRLMATLSFHAPTQRFDLDRALTFRDALHAAAEKLARLVDDRDPA
jgi:DNA-binding IclR family transcriptional regulator